MVQFRILSGKKAGTACVARRFPFRVGRSATGDLTVDDEGVWDAHLQVDFKPGEGFLVSTQGGAMTSVNSQPVQSALLRNGDVIGMGSVKVQFWLSETVQRGLAVREWLTWAGIGLICVGQIGLIYWLLGWRP
jgi:pSer/pThr/pTyr-binding forkhead associated (FHA) protein